MLDKFLSYIKEEKLLTKNDRILLAVSGGMDSMAMVTLFLQANISIGVAHINHHLRGKESDADQNFVQKYCEKNEIPFYIHHIDPNIFIVGNMHDTARSIRYEWLNKISVEEHFDYIATAHHRDDEAETFLIHLMRGSGLDGLDGFLQKNNNIIRPLLFADRNEILDFVQKNHISYREDSSNNSDKYMRNRVRHHVLPAIYTMDDRSKDGISLSIKNLKNSSHLLQFLVKEYTGKWIKKQENMTAIDLSGIKDNATGIELLYQMIKPYGFNSTQCTDILQKRKSTGNRYFSARYEALTDRESLLVRHKEVRDKYEWPMLIEPPMEVKMNECTLQFDLITNSETFDFEQNKLYLDTNDLTFPLTLMPWKPGDTFTPLGMKGKSQKVKDFLINNKISGFEKENIMVLRDQEKIIAIPGYRVSEKVRVDQETKTILRITSKKLTVD